MNNFSGELFDQYFLNSIDLLCISDMSGRFIRLNPEWERTLGYTLEDVTNLQYYELIHPDDIEETRSAARDLVDRKLVKEFVNRIRHKQGHYLWIEWRSFLFGPYIYASARDITHQIEHERFTRETQEKFRIAFENAPSGMSIIRSDGSYIAVNPMLSQMLGYSAEELMQGTLHTITYSEDVERSNEWIRKNIAGEKCEPDFEKRYVHKDGRIVWGLVRSQWVKDIEGKPLMAVTHILDITARKEAEAAIQNVNRILEKKVAERTRELDQSVKDLQSFTYSVSHDLRAPIRHIDGFMKLLYARIVNPGEAVNNYYFKVKEAVTRMSVMIDSLLVFSRLGRKEPVYSRINLDHLVREIIHLYQHDTANRELEWTIQPLPDIYADKNLMKLVFENLISNAIKYTSKSEHPEITIGVTAGEADFHELFIRDNGIGFNMQYADKLFGVFQRLHNNEDYEGIGIGLANVKQIIDKHKGSVRAEGKLNEGAIFYIKLPK